jgi:hypothetical protein
VDGLAVAAEKFGVRLGDLEPMPRPGAPAEGASREEQERLRALGCVE